MDDSAVGFFAANEERAKAQEAADVMKLRETYAAVVTKARSLMKTVSELKEKNATYRKEAARAAEENKDLKDMIISLEDECEDL